MTVKDIDVVVPAYNAERFLAEALEQILQQGVPGEQVWVVDDGSSDGTADVARSHLPHTQLLHTARAASGPGAAVNQGLARCRCELVAFCDADDVWLPQKLSRQLQVLNDDPACDLVFGWLQQFGEGRVDQAMPAVSRPAMLARRRVFSRVGGFREDLRAGEFIDWLARAEEQGVQQRTLPDVLYRRRLHDDNLGRREQHAGLDYLRLLKNALDRRRGAQ